MTGTQLLIGVLEAIAPLGIMIMLIALGLLSRRLLKASQAPPRHLGFFVAAALFGVNALARLANALDGEVSSNDTLRLLLYDGLPATALTLALASAWRCWSWLLAERS